MKKNKKRAHNSAAGRFSWLIHNRSVSVSSAKLYGYNGKTFEKTIRNFWRQVTGFSCEWCDGWDESFSPDYTPSNHENAVTFITTIKDAEGELERGNLYMIHNTTDNTVTAVGFVDKNDGYVQEYTAEELENALKTVFDEYN